MNRDLSVQAKPRGALEREQAKQNLGRAIGRGVTMALPGHVWILSSRGKLSFDGGVEENLFRKFLKLYRHRFQLELLSEAAWWQVNRWAPSR